MQKKDTVLVIGACGQLGTELTVSLREIFGANYVIASDVATPSKELAEGGPFEHLDATNEKGIAQIIEQYKVTQVYLLAAILSAKGEQNPTLARDINMSSLSHVLEIAKEKPLAKVYWPSSIAVFGANTPHNNTPQDTIMQPDTVYGITKLSGELWCQYYYQKYGVDVRSLRYPGLIGYKSLPGGGTTDYAVDIYHKAVKGEAFDCFLSEDTTLPMMYMPDAIRGTLELMEAPADQLRVRTSYNMHGMSFSPREITAAIQQHYPTFAIQYKPDFRQKIADTWPKSIDDSAAQNDWNWKPAYDLQKMTTDMLKNLK